MVEPLGRRRAKNLEEGKQLEAEMEMAVLSWTLQQRAMVAQLVCGPID